MKIIVTILCLVALSCALPLGTETGFPDSVTLNDTTVLPELNKGNAGNASRKTRSTVTELPDSVTLNDATILPELNKENEGNANRKARDIVDTPTPALVISPSGGVGLPLGPSIAISAGPNPSNPDSPPEVFAF